MSNILALGLEEADVSKLCALYEQFYDSSNDELFICTPVQNELD